MSENLGNRYSSMVGSSNPSVIESVQSMNGKFHASNGDRSLWISDSHCPELCIDLDETVWKPDGSGLDKSDLMLAIYSTNCGTSSKHGTRSMRASGRHANSDHCE
jgi:hypothetical protein